MPAAVDQTTVCLGPQHKFTQARSTEGVGVLWAVPCVAPGTQQRVNSLIRVLARGSRGRLFSFSLSEK